MNITLPGKNVFSAERCFNRIAEKLLNSAIALLIICCVGNTANAQTYISIASTDWNNVDTWVANANLTGTITTSTANANVTGSGTAFTTQLVAGAKLTTTGGTVIGTILTVNTPTSITLTSNAASTNTGIAFRARKIPLAANDVIINGHAVTLTSANAAALSVSLLNSSSITVSSTFQLSVTNDITFDNSTTGSSSATLAGAGTISCGSLIVSPNDYGGTSGPFTGTLTSTVTSLNVTGAGGVTISSWRNNQNSRRIDGIFNINSGTVSISTGSVTTTNENGANTTTLSLANAPQTGTLVLGAVAPFSLSGTGTNTITLNGTGATVQYNRTAGGQTILGETYTNLTLNNTSGTSSPDGDLTVNGTLTTTAGGTLGMGTAFVLNGTLATITNGGTISTGVPTATNAAPIPAGKTWGGTVIYTATAGSQTVVAGTYNNLTVSNTSATNAAGGNLVVNGTLTTTAGGTLAMGTTAILSGTLATITNGGTISTAVPTATSATPIPSGKTWGGTITYAATAGAQTIVAGTYNNLAVSNTSATNSAGGNLVVNGTLTTTAGGTLAMGTTAILSGTLATITNGGTISTAVPTATSATPIPSGKTWGGTVAYAATTGAQTIVAATSYNNLTLSNTSGTSTPAANLVVNGTLATAAGGTLDMGTTFTLTGTLGTITNNGTISTSVPTATSATPLASGKTWGGTGTVIYAVTTGAQTIVAGTYNNLTLSNTSGTNTPGGSLVVNGTLTIGAGGTLNMGSTATLTGTLGTITNGGTITTSVPTATSATPLASGKTWSGNVVYALATGAQTLVGGTYNNLTLSNTSGTNAASGGVTVNGALVTSAGTLNMGTNQLLGTLSSITIGGTLQTQNTTSTPIPTGKTWGGTIQYNTTAGGQTVMAGTYNNLTLSNTSNTQTASGALTVNGALTTTAGGTLNMVTFQLLGTLSSVNNGGTVRTQNTSATPVPSGIDWNGTFQYDGGNQTVQNVVYVDLILGGTNTKSFAGAVTVSSDLSIVSGVTANLGTFTSSANTLALNAQGQNAGSYGGTGSGATYINTTYFTAASGILNVTTATCTAGTWLGTTSTDWFTATNWCGGTVPVAATNVVIPSGGNQPTIGSAGAVCSNLTINAGATLTLGASGGISVSGTFTKTGTLSANATSTFNYAQATGTQTLVANSYGNLTLSGGGTKTFPGGTVGIAGTFTPNAFTTASAGTIDFSSATSQTIPAFNYNILTNTGNGARVFANSGTIAIASTFTPGSGAYTVTGSTVSFTSGSAQAIPVPTPAATYSYNNLSLSGAGTKTPSAAFSIGGNLSISAGTLSLNNTASARNYTILGNYQQSGGTTDFCTSTGQTTINIEGNVTQTAGNFDASGGSAPNGILNFDGTGIQTLNYTTPANNEFIKYTIASGATLKLASNLNIRRSGTATFQGVVSVASGGTLDVGTFVISQVNGTAGTAVFTLGSGAKLITANTGGVASSIVSTNTTLTYTAGAQYEFNSTVAGQSFGFTGLTIGNPNLITISNTTTAGVTPDVNITLGNAATLNVNAGATLVAAATRTFTFGTGGVVNIDGTVQTANTSALGALYNTATSTIVNTNSPTININTTTSVIEFNGAASQAIESRTYGGVKISNASGVNMGGNVTVSATLNLNTGELGINGNTLTLNGPVTRTSGNLRGSITSNLNVNGTAGSLFFATGGNNNYLKTLTIGASGSATLGNALNITAYDGVSSEGVLTVTSGGTLTTGGFLAIKSNVNGTARIAANTSGSTYISGDVSVERFIHWNASKAWRLLASNTSGQTIKEAWQENQSNSMSDPNPFFGTKIPAGNAITTNLTTARTTLGFDTLSTGVSLFKYNPATDGLEPVPNTNSTAFASEPGYFIFIRGSRAPGGFGAGAPSDSTVLRSKGTLFQGSQTTNTGAQNYGLVRNPYASRIDMRNIVRGASLIDAYQVWDAKLGGAFGVGGFQTFTKITSGINAGSYAVVPGSGSYGSNGSVQNFIESGSAFYIQSTNHNGIDNWAQVTEGCKVSGGSNDSYRPSGVLADDKRISFTLYALNPGSADVVDGGLVFFNDTYSNSVTIEDVRKSGNFNENFGILRDNTELVVEKRKDVAASDSIFFKMYQLRQISYRLDFDGLNFDPGVTTAVLQDKFTNTNTPINLSSLTSYTFTVSATAGSFAQDRFRLVLSVSPNTFSGTGNWTDNARWSKGIPPVSGEPVIIAAGANAALNADFTVGASLTMNPTSTLVVNPTKTLSITGTADFAGQSVTFKSDATGYGSLGQLTGTLNGATNVTVERYIPNNGFRSWRLLSVPTFGNGQTIRQAWQEGNANPLPLQNNLPNYGTQITGVFATPGAANAAGFDSTSVQAGMLTWNGTGWSNVTSTNQSIANNKAYFLYVRGERSKGVSGSVNNSSATTLRTNGTVYTGNQLFNIPTGSFSVVANLYPCAIDFTALTRSNVNNLFYIWDSKKQNGNSLGVYQTFSFTNSFNCLVGGGSYILGQPNTAIESGQAFFVTGGATAGGGTVTLVESAKVSGTSGNLGFRPSAVPAKIDSRLLDVNNDVLDANVVVFDKAYSNAVDADDATKFGNPGANFAIETNSKILAIEGTQPVTENDVIQFRMWNLKQQDYKLEFAPANMNVHELHAILEDKYLNRSREIDLKAVTAINFTVNGDAASSMANRFRIVFSKNKPVAAIEQGYSIAPNPVTGRTINLFFKNQPAGSYSIKVASAEGKLVMTKVINYAGGSSNQLVVLPSRIITGNYQVEIIAPGQTKTIKQLIVKTM